MHQTQFSEKIPYGGFSQIRSHIVSNFSVKVVMRICYKREWNAHADRMLKILLTSKNSAKLKQCYYFHAKFLEEIRYHV